MLLLFLGDTFCHANGTCWTNQTAEVAAYTLSADNARLTRLGVEADGLMTAVHARGVATSAADTLVTVNLWIDDSLAV